MGKALVSVSESRDSPSSLPCPIRKVSRCRAQLLSPHDQNHISTRLQSKPQEHPRTPSLYQITPLCCQPDWQMDWAAETYTVATRPLSPLPWSRSGGRVPSLALSVRVPSKLRQGKGRHLVQVSCLFHPLLLHRRTDALSSLAPLQVVPDGRLHRCGEGHAYGSSGSSSFSCFSSSSVGASGPRPLLSQSSMLPCQS